MTNEYPNIFALGKIDDYLEEWIYSSKYIWIYSNICPTLLHPIITQYTIQNIQQETKKQKTKDKRQNNILGNGHNKRNVKLKYIQIKIQYKKYLTILKKI